MDEMKAAATTMARSQKSSVMATKSVIKHFFHNAVEEMLGFIA